MILALEARPTNQRPRGSLGRSCIITARAKNIRQSTFNLNLASIMAPPSKLAVATSSVTRLVKEEASYHKELEQQQARIKKLEESTGDENAEYQLKQEVIVCLFAHSLRVRRWLTCLFFSAKLLKRPRTSFRLSAKRSRMLLPSSRTNS